MSFYTNYLASTSFRPYLQPMPGLGSSARTAGAVILGGPRAGAGSAGRVYNFLKSTGEINKVLYSNEFQKIRDRFQIFNASSPNLYGGRYYI
jgi:hypothetical protein